MTCGEIFSKDERSDIFLLLMTGIDTVRLLSLRRPGQPQPAVWTLGGRIRKSVRARVAESMRVQNPEAAKQTSDALTPSF